MSTLVIVESPAKAKTIQKYLPDGYVVLASMGHVRDLPDNAGQLPEALQKEPWAKLGVNTLADFDAVYVVKDRRSKMQVAELKKALKQVDHLILATDEDREGEAISWHLSELLEPGVPTTRMVFNEITKSAIQDALKNTREVDMSLVEAQETRRILDRLVGYPLSLLVGKKIKYGLGAGRVQSAAVKILVDRERDRRRFRVGSYWDVKARLSAKNEPFHAALHDIDGKRIASGKDFDENTGQIAAGRDVLLLSEPEARALEAALRDKPWLVTDVQQTPYTTSPKPPFTTSTLQQEASRKLGLGAKQTMSLAQRLYENGFITYMRTDSVHLSTQAVEAARKAARDLYGESYLPEQPRTYRSGAKNAQEAHEAIRPSGDSFVRPEQANLSGQEAQLYDLIWKRTVACQMADAKKTRFRVELAVSHDDKAYNFRAHGNQIDFPGFIRAYFEGTDDPEAALEDTETLLPAMTKGQKVDCKTLEALGHETRPPARFTEASLVRALEEQGIGRPSTYATIMDKITNDARYARREGRTLTPTYIALAVTAFLERYFPELVELAFTARMEDELDEIAAGQGSKIDYLHKFYRQPGAFADKIDRYDREIDPEQARAIDLEDFPATLRVGRFGPYVQVDEGGELRSVNVPDDVPPADLSMDHIREQLRRIEEGPEVLGDDPETGKPIFLKEGPFGPYIQLGPDEADAPEEEEAATAEVVEAPAEPAKKGKKAAAKPAAAKKPAKAKKPVKAKPKRVSIPRDIRPDEVSLELALDLLSLPRTLGEHPESGKKVQAGLGRFGPYLKHEDDFRSVKGLDVLLSITLDEALIVFSQPKRGGKQVLRELGVHAPSGETVSILDGRYGPYIKLGKANVSVPKDDKVEDLTLERALALLVEKVGEEGLTGKKAKQPAAKKVGAASTTKKAATSPKAAKKAASKQPAASADDAPAAKKPAAKKATAAKTTTTAAKKAAATKKTAASKSAKSATGTKP